MQQNLPVSLFFLQALSFSDQWVFNLGPFGAGTIHWSPAATRKPVGGGFRSIQRLTGWPWKLLNNDNGKTNQLKMNLQFKMVIFIVMLVLSGVILCTCLIVILSHSISCGGVTLGKSTTHPGHFGSIPHPWFKNRIGLGHKIKNIF